MNCQNFQCQLLAAPDPGQPPAEVVAHLAECPACLAWQQRLTRLERQIPQIPIPRSREGKRELFRKLHAGKGGEWEAPRKDRVGGSQTQPLANSHSPTIPWLHGLTLAAAGLLLLVSGWVLFKGSPTPQAARHDRQPPPRDPLLAHLLDHSVQLSQSSTPRQRVEQVRRLVDDLHRRTEDLRPLASQGTLKQLARLYERVVQDVVVESARQVPLDERRAVLLPVAEQLLRVSDQTELWMQEGNGTDLEPLRQIGQVARAGDQQLRSLVQEGTP
jgi:hypothetical protein